MPLPNRRGVPPRAADTYQGYNVTCYLFTPGQVPVKVGMVKYNLYASISAKRECVLESYDLNGEIYQHSYNNGYTLDEGQFTLYWIGNRASPGENQP